MANGGPIIISTRTKICRTQLVGKDIPAVQKLLSRAKFPHTGLKGPKTILSARLELLSNNMLRLEIKVIPCGAFWPGCWNQEGDLSNCTSSLENVLRLKFIPIIIPVTMKSVVIFGLVLSSMSARQARLCRSHYRQSCPSADRPAGGAGLLPEYRDWSVMKPIPWKMLWPKLLLALCSLVLS